MGKAIVSPPAPLRSSDQRRWGLNTLMVYACPEKICRFGVFLSLAEKSTQFLGTAKLVLRLIPLGCIERSWTPFKEP
jgi:hypothetical protein